MSGEKCFNRNTSERSQTTSVSSMPVTLCTAKLRMRLLRCGGMAVPSPFQPLTRRKVGTKRTVKSTRRIISIDTAMPITPQWNATVDMVIVKKVTVEMNDAGRLADKSSVATFANAEMELTIEGQTLSTSRMATKTTAGTNP